MLQQVRVYVKGDVIGVGFRAWTKIRVKILGGIDGWVKNVYDRPEIFGVHGGVEVLLLGEEIKIEKMITLLRQGPPIANVEDLEIYREQPKEMLEGFEIKK